MVYYNRNLNFSGFDSIKQTNAQYVKVAENRAKLKDAISTRLLQRGSLTQKVIEQVEKIVSTHALQFAINLSNSNTGLL